MNQLSIFYPLVTVETDEAFLRKKSDTIRVFDTEVEEFANVLVTLMYKYDGIGLAAPQL
jgi:peptide deformylase